MYGNSVGVPGLPLMGFRGAKGLGVPDGFDTKSSFPEKVESTTVGLAAQICPAGHGVGDGTGVGETAADGVGVGGGFHACADGITRS